MGRRVRHARRMVWMVQRFLDLPPLLVLWMLGEPFVPLKVAWRVGASGGSRNMCIKRMCWACFTVLEMLGTLFGGGGPFSLPLPLPFPLPFCFLAYSSEAARLRTSLLVFARSM